MKNSERNRFLGLIMGLSIIATVLFVGMSYAQTGNINETADSLLTNTSSSGDEGVISITVPVEKGYVNGNISYFISTDASEEMIVSSVTNTTKFKVNYAPTLSNTSEISRQQGYVFINGILGNGTFEHQLPVASASGGDLGYSPLFEINYVKWNNDSQPRVLKSAGEILDAESKGELSIQKSNIVINSPAVEVKQ
jgi:hypothetical protein